MATNETARGAWQAHAGQTATTVVADHSERVGLLEAGREIVQQLAARAAADPSRNRAEALRAVGRRLERALAVA